jgi:hypothetical protein
MEKRDKLAASVGPDPDPSGVALDCLNRSRPDAVVVNELGVPQPSRPDHTTELHR